MIVLKRFHETIPPPTSKTCMRLIRFKYFQESHPRLRVLFFVRYFEMESVILRSMITTLTTLPIDIFLAISTHLGLEDILSIRQTCKTLAQITRLRSVWHLHITHKIIDNGIPIPGLDQIKLESLESAKLEQCVYRALRLRRRWFAPPELAPRCRHIDFGEGQMAWLRFLQSHGRRYLVALRLTKTPDASWEASCWDVQSSTPNPICVGRRSFRISSPLVTYSFAFNVDSTNPISLATQQEGSDIVELIGLDFTSGDPSKAFTTLGVYPSKNRKVRHVCGENLISVDENEKAFFWGETCDIELQDSRDANIRHGTRGFLVVQNRFVLVCRVRELLLYILPPERHRKAQHLIYPAATYKWQWAIDSICLAPQMSRASETAERPPVINILLRFGSFLPWPINLLHYFILEPSLGYDEADANSLSRLPYLFPPQLKQTIAAPILMFSSSHMTLGPYGTALWIDDHAEEYFSMATRGQRVAGLFCPKLLEDADGTAELDEWKTSTMTAAVYTVQKGGGWTRLAMDEEEGRIAIGSSDGQIIINDYA